MDCFDNSNINLEVLKKKAFNYRWQRCRMA